MPNNYRHSGDRKKDIGNHYIYLIYNMAGYMPFSFLQDAIEVYNRNPNERTLVGRNYKTIKHRTVANDTVLHQKNQKSKYYLVRKC